MLTEHQKSLIRCILKDADAEEMVTTLMSEFAKQSIENARTVLNHSKKVTDIALGLANKETIEASQAAFWLMCQTTMDKKDKVSMFSSMVPVCKVLFPNGESSDQSCEAGKRYFRQFVEYLGNKKVFDFDYPADISWAKMNGYEEYLTTVAKKNGVI